MVELRDLGTLQLEEPLHPDRPAHLGAASGLVRRGRNLYVVADDEVALGVFDAEERGPGRLLPLAHEDLPVGHDERKAAKPDLEALCQLPAGERWTDGVLFAVGSGSTHQRERGWLWALEGNDLAGGPVEVSLSALYEQLRDELEDLNIEGAAVVGDHLWLAQRGNGEHGANVLIELALDECLHALEHDSALPGGSVRGLHEHDLGEARGVPLTFSDLTPFPDGRLVFCAVAEDSASTYFDGECVGAVVGILNPRGGKPQMQALPEPHKIEGVTVTSAGPETLEVLLVADADDASVAAPLYAATVPLVT